MNRSLKQEEQTINGGKHSLYTAARGGGCRPPLPMTRATKCHLVVVLVASCVAGLFRNHSHHPPRNNYSHNLRSTPEVRTTRVSNGGYGRDSGQYSPANRALLTQKTPTLTGTRHKTGPASTPNFTTVAMTPPPYIPTKTWKPRHAVSSLQISTAKAIYKYHLFHDTRHTTSY